MDKKISMVIPFYNEESNVESVIREAVGVLSELASDFEIIAVNDGSTDETRYIIDTLSKQVPQLKPVHHKKNAGYGGALHSGIEAATGDYLLLIDGDGQFYMKEFKDFVQNLKEYKVVLGYRINRQDPLVRKINSAIYNLCARILVGVRIRDINCAMKAFDASVLQDIKFRTRGAIINSDILSQILTKGVRFKELGVNHRPRLTGQPTGAKLKVIINAMKEFIAVFIDEFPKRRAQMFLSLRIFFGFIAAILVIIFARPSSGNLFWVGMALAACGVFVRNWASGYLKKSQVLCRIGPYSLVRHPLYFGSMLIGLGVLVSLINSVSLTFWAFCLGLFLAIFFLIYIPKISTEEQNLGRWFGDEYDEYRNSVGMLFPKFKSVQPAFEEFRLSQWKKNKEFQSIIGFAIIYIILYLKRI